MWRGDHIVYDCLRVISFVGAIFIVNTARLYFTIVWYAEGVSWKYAHGLVNHLTYTPIAVLIFLLWLKAVKLRSLRALKAKNWL